MATCATSPCTTIPGTSHVISIKTAPVKRSASMDAILYEPARHVKRPPANPFRAVEFLIADGPMVSNHRRGS